MADPKSDTASPDTDEAIDSWALEMKRIGNRAVRKAQEENRRLGIPNTYSHRGQLYFELPSGELTLEDPFADEDEPATS
jgi:hypothetical protein